MSLPLMVLVSYVVAHIVKVIVASTLQKRFMWKVVFLPGGIPSAHSALVSSLVTAIFLVQGASVVFWASLVFGVIIVYDAMTLRRQVGVHTRMLGRLHLKVTREEARQYLSDDHVGHTPTEVALGIIIGVLVPLVMRLV